MNIVRDIDFNWHHIKFGVRIHECRANVSLISQRTFIAIRLSRPILASQYRIWRYEYKLRIYEFDIYKGKDAI